jgi:hypothetical protein
MNWQAFEEKASAKTIEHLQSCYKGCKQNCENYALMLKEEKESLTYREGRLESIGVILDKCHEGPIDEHTEYQRYLYRMMQESICRIKPTIAIYQKVFYDCKLMELEVASSLSLAIKSAYDNN